MASALALRHDAGTMARIVTLTLNPAIDNSCEAERVCPTQKTRTFDERMQPGGGGINVARVLQRLGADVHAIFLGGGATGLVLDELLDRTGVGHSRIPISDDTRTSLTVFERLTGREFRFVPEGPDILQSEWQACLVSLEGLQCDYFVASGSLPRGVPDDFYARAWDILRRRNTRFILDTSGPELPACLARGGLFLVKPSAVELEELSGRKLTTRNALADAASAIVAEGQSELVAVTLGREGAILVDRDGGFFVPGAEVETRSAVGAGDSFLAAMLHGLANGKDARAALRLGVAAGGAAALTQGSDLAHPSDIDVLLESMAEGVPV